VTSAGLLHVAPLNRDHCNLPLMAVAAQITLPFPSLVQLGSELTAPDRVVHVPQEVPLNSLTMTAYFPLRIAHTTWRVVTWAHDGVPIEVPAPVEMNFQTAQAELLRPRQAGNRSKDITRRDMGIPLRMESGAGGGTAAGLYNVVRNAGVTVLLAAIGFHRYTCFICLGLGNKTRRKRFTSKPSAAR
jgi:hypothetical protein